MIAGHLQEKYDLYYIVLNYKDEAGKRKTKWIPTSLPVKGNKKKAEALLAEAKRTFVPPKKEVETIISSNMLFADYLSKWLVTVKSTISVPTYGSYEGMIRTVIAPYFRNRMISLEGIMAAHIQEFYSKELERVSANTVIHYHAVIHRALKYAVKMDLIQANPADKIERPKKDKYVGSFYDSTEMNTLFAAVEGTRLELPVKLAAFYGLRRSEVLGLKWDAIDFNNNTITIRHTVTSCNVNGKLVEVAADRTKTKSSMRTLPLVPAFRDLLLAEKEKQKVNRRLCGNSYCQDYIGYLCVNEIGERFKPMWLTNTFGDFLAANELRHIRFHDLRHSCASLLLANGVPMKQIQEWLGHSDFATTANIYAHLDYQSKITSADAMLNGLGMNSEA